MQLKSSLRAGPNVLESMSFLSVKHFQSVSAELTIKASPGIRFNKDLRFFKVLWLVQETWSQRFPERSKVLSSQKHKDAV